MNKSIELVKKLEGVQTVETISKELNVKRSTAINIAHKLRKEGYLENWMGRRKRLYKITPKKNIRIGNPGFYEILDKYSRIKLIVPYEHRVIGKRLTVEEALIRAVKTKNIRIIIVSLELFNHIENWRLLSKLAEEEKLERFVGALYDAARTIIKVRRMDKRVRNKLLKGKVKRKHLLLSVKSKDLKEIEKRWNIYLPINKADLMMYKEW
ncbi:hypothetical protein J4406_00445 [Candidatus Woesearchaeota archaeon]|nr:hypothetical protein [Candidatus Woesearchaeota archaeon]